MTFTVRQTTAAGAWATLHEEADEGDARIAFALRRTTAPAGRTTELLAPSGAVLASDVSDRRRVYKAVRPRRAQLELF